MSDPIPKMICGEESFHQVERVGIALFNRLIVVGGCVAVAGADGTKQTAKLTKPGWINDVGESVCEVEGFESPVLCGRVTPFVDANSAAAAAKPTKPKRERASLF
jgi:hypothetical protein